MRSVVKRVGSTLSVLAILALLVAVIAPATAMAQDEPPQPPMRLEGYVFIAGERAGDGTLVEVFIEGELAGSARTTTLEGRAGFYTVDLQSLEPVEVAVTVDGEPAFFLVDGEPEETVPFDIGTQPYDVVIGDAPVTYKLTMVVVGEGITAPAEGEHQYAEGTQVRVGALPAAGWQFDGWAGDVADADATTTRVTLDGDKVVTAQFSRGPTAEAAEAPTDTPVPPATDTPVPEASPATEADATATADAALAATAEAAEGATEQPTAAESGATAATDEAATAPATAVAAPTAAQATVAAATATVDDEPSSSGEPSEDEEPEQAGAEEAAQPTPGGEGRSGPPWLVVGAIALAALGLGGIGFGLWGLRRTDASG